MIAALGHHLIPRTEQPVEHLGRAKAAVEAEHNVGAPFAAPSQMGFDLQQRGFQGRHSGLLPPEQRLMEYLPILARRDSKGLPTGFTPIAPHPGPLTSLRLVSYRHPREISLYQHQLGVDG